jgi:hypothetical protein
VTAAVPIRIRDFDFLLFDDLLFGLPLCGQSQTLLQLGLITFTVTISFSMSMKNKCKGSRIMCTDQAEMKCQCRDFC